MEVPASAIRQEKETIRGKEGVTSFLFADDMISCMGNPETAPFPLPPHTAKQKSGGIDKWIDKWINWQMNLVKLLWVGGSWNVGAF